MIRPLLIGPALGEHGTVSKAVLLALRDL